MSRVLIVGGGIGGLTCALTLSRRGARVTLIEREPTFSPVGAGIVLAPNAMAILQQQGVSTAAGERLQRMLLCTAGGRILQQVDVGDFLTSHGPTYAFHRVELHQALVAALPADVEVRCGTALSSLSESDGAVEVRLADRAERFDLVVGADGIHSQTRKLLGGGSESRYSGYTCWRAVCANPGITDSLEVWGRGARVGAVPLSGGRLYAFLVANAPRRAPAPAWPEGFEALFGDFCDPCPQVLRALEGVPLMHHDLEELDAPVWGQGRVWLLGDAAHAMTPNLGQGAASAIEDALVLARSFDGDPKAGHARYVAARQARVRKLQLDSRRLGRLAHWSNPAAVWTRDALVGLLPRSIGDRQYRDVVEPGLELARAS